MQINRREFIKTLSFLAAASSVYAPSFAGFGTSQTFPELKAGGSYGTLGYEHGKKFALLIEKNLNFYKRWIPSPLTDKTEELIRAAESFVSLLMNRFPHQVEEMEGIAKGAGLTLTDIMIINARTDLRSLYTRNKPHEDRPGCTSLAIRSTKDSASALALGQNWDWNTEFMDTAVILRLEPDNSPPLVTFTEAGMLGKIGFNRNKLGVCLNFLSHESENRADPVGIPIHCLLRAVMECGSLDEAHQKVALSQRCASANFLMAQYGDKNHGIMNLEITPDSVAVIRDEKDFFIHTNHYLSPSLEQGCMDRGSFSTENRYLTGYECLSQMDLNAVNPVEAMKQVLKLRKGAPYSVSRSPAPNSQSTTIAGIIMDLGRNTFYLAAGSPHENPWLKYRWVE